MSVLLDIDGETGIAFVTLDRPEKFNALSSGLLQSMQDTLDEVGSRQDVRVVVLNANGKGFCVGHDLEEVRSSEDEIFHISLFRQCSRMMQTMVALPQPIIASVQGVATAAGCQLVAAADLAVTAEDARFAVSGINLGLFCSTPAVALSRVVGRKNSLKMLFTGDFISAAEAGRIGLVNDVVSPQDLKGATLELASVIAAKSSAAVRIGKEMFYRQAQLNLADAYDYAGRVMAQNMMEQDARDGIDGFLAKRSAGKKATGRSE